MEHLDIHRHTHMGMKGYFKLETFKGIRVVTKDPLLPNFVEPEDAPMPVLVFPGTHRVRQDWAPNRILNSGKDVMGTQANWLTHCQVGTDATTPAVGQSALLAFLVATSTIEETITGAQGTIPYYMYKRVRYRFAQGDAAGNLNEVGTGYTATPTGTPLICRHRTRNSTGVYATITVASDEYLDVSYELRYYPPLNDVVEDTPTLILNGVGYDTVTRASQVTSNIATRIGTKMGVYVTATGDWNAWDGEIGAITGTPVGNSASCDNTNHTNGTYNNGTYQVTMTANCGPTGWNLGAGIRSIRIMTAAGNFQTRFGAHSGDATIPKTSAYTMALTWTLSWGEYIGIQAVPATYTMTGVAAQLDKVVP